MLQTVTYSGWSLIRVITEVIFKLRILTKYYLSGLRIIFYSKFCSPSEGTFQDEVSEPSSRMVSHLRRVDAIGFRSTVHRSRLTLCHRIPLHHSSRINTSFCWATFFIFKWENGTAPKRTISVRITILIVYYQDSCFKNGRLFYSAFEIECVLQIF